MRIGIGLGIGFKPTNGGAPPVPAPPVNIEAPLLSGTGAVESTVTCSSGVWTGSPTPTYTYIFYVDGVEEQNSSSNEFFVRESYDGLTITAEVTATNTEGSATEPASNSIVVGTIPVNTVEPTLSPSGIQSTGTLITINERTWDGTPPLTFEYRWLRDGVVIDGEDGKTYTIAVEDDGTVITAEVRASNAYGVSIWVLTSNQVDAVNAVAPSNVTTPVISGSTSLGSVLTTTNGTWSGVPATFSYTYQWKRNGSPISGATAITYTTVVADSLANITCEVTADNGVAPTATAESNTITMANYRPVISVNPVISGSTSLGSKLTTTNGTWTNSPSTFTYQWFRGASPISGATNNTYVTVVTDSTASITCRVTASNGLTSSPATSNALVMANYTPANTVSPSVTGTAVVGQTLSTTNGTWTNSPSTYSYQWYRGATLISGATNSTYTLVQADAGVNIVCRVTASNGLSASADSNTVAILATLLDLYPNAAAAYSVRLLRGAYLGSSAIRVRRSNDSAEQNIGFTSSGNLDTTALLAFVGSNSGFVVTWYDQSGNGENETQTTRAKQARIVNAGVVALVNNKPALRFDGTDTSYINTTIGATTSKSVYFVKKGEVIAGPSSLLGFPTTATSTQLGLYYLNTGPFPYGINTWTGDTFGYNSGNSDFLAQTIEMCLLINGAPQTSGVKLFVNNVQKILTQVRGTSVSRTMANGFRIGMGGDEASNQNYDGFFQEIVLYNGDNSTTDRSAITTNQNNYYAVY